jgi:hypothetical protein
LEAIYRKNNIHHRDTEDTEKEKFVAVKLPAGIISFIQSPSPDWIKKYNLRNLRTDYMLKKFDFRLLYETIKIAGKRHPKR